MGERACYCEAGWGKYEFEPAISLTKTCVCFFLRLPAPVPCLLFFCGLARLSLFWDRGCLLWALPLMQ